MHQASRLAQERKLQRGSWKKLNIFYSLPKFDELRDDGPRAKARGIGGQVRKPWAGLSLPGFQPMQ